MLSIRTTSVSNVNGTAQVKATANGKQRTVAVDLAASVEVNHASAAGALLNVLTTGRQQSMLRHPSGGQRVRVKSISPHGGQYRWTIDI